MWLGALTLAAVPPREDASDCLLRARVGRMMVERNLTHEVHFAARLSALDAVPVLEGGRLVA